MGAPAKDTDSRPAGTSFAGEGVAVVPEALTLTTSLSGDRDIRSVRQIGTRTLRLEDGKRIEDPIYEIVMGISMSEQIAGRRQTPQSFRANESDVRKEKVHYRTLCEAVKNGYIHWPYDIDQATLDARWTQVLKMLPPETPAPTPAA